MPRRADVVARPIVVPAKDERVAAVNARNAKSTVTTQLRISSYVPDSAVAIANTLEHDGDMRHFRCAGGAGRL
jgi:hypothetical protein